MIRGDLLSSERYASVSDGAKVLFIAILLSADDAGLFEAGSFALARAATLPIDRIDPLRDELTGADLVRTYRQGEKLFGFVPRYRQRLQRTTLRHPVPPADVVRDDASFVEICAKLKLTGLHGGLPDDPLLPSGSSTVESQSGSSKPSGEQRQISDAQPPEVEVEVEGITTHPSGVLACGPCPHGEILKLWEVRLPEHIQPKTWTGTRRTHLAARWRETAKRRSWASAADGLTWFDELFRDIAEHSSFLTGRAPGTKGRSSFMATLDWLVQAGNFARVVDGEFWDRRAA
ncbi:hypothetical protein IP84_00765 [beta proteobacterium AAP99]|nr:hypothetical protein IP84_00765 [beta proteobacterium AAP99]